MICKVHILINSAIDFPTISNIIKRGNTKEMSALSNKFLKNELTYSLYTV